MNPKATVCLIVLVVVSVLVVFSWTECVYVCSVSEQNVLTLDADSLFVVKVMVMRLCAIGQSV